MTTEAHARTSNEKIHEALELLNEAAKEKKEELQVIMTDKYAHIKEAMSAGVARGEAALKQAREMVGKSGEKVHEIAVDVDKRVHKDPWPYIAGAAAVALLLGYFMGASRNK